MFPKIFYKQMWLCLLMAILLVRSSIVLADDGLVISPISPNDRLGISGVNGDLEIAHLNEPVYGHVLTSNYQQAQNAGIKWSRWLIRWNVVEETDGIFVWEKPGEFNYIDLAQMEQEWGVNQVIILNEIPEIHKRPAEEDLIEGVWEEIFLTRNGTTDDPYNSDILGINPANKWAMFFYQAASNFSSDYWQIMNELNINPVWDTDPVLGQSFPGRGAFVYVRLLKIANKVILYLGSDAKIIVGGLVYTFQDTMANDMGENCPAEHITLNKWAEQMLCYLEEEMVMIRVLR